MSVLLVLSVGLGSVLVLVDEADSLTIVSQLLILQLEVLYITIGVYRDELYMHYDCQQGNSPDKLHHTRSVAYSVELVVLNKHQISGGGAHLNCYRRQERHSIYPHSDELPQLNSMIIIERERTVTGQLADKPTRSQSSCRLVNLRTRQLAEMCDL